MPLINEQSNPPRAIPWKRIYSRLGYHKHKSEISQAQKRKIDSYIEEAYEYNDTRIRWKSYPFISTSDNEIDINGYKIKSHKLYAFLDNCTEILTAVSSVGKKILAKRDEYSEKGVMAKAVVYDAVAAETADSGLDWLASYLNQTYTRKGLTLTKHRISPGYSDMDLSIQKWIYEELRLDELEIIINDSMLLIPEKTVTAFYGVKGAMKDRGQQ